MCNWNWPNGIDKKELTPCMHCTVNIYLWFWGPWRTLDPSGWQIMRSMMDSIQPQFWIHNSNWTGVLSQYARPWVWPFLQKLHSLLLIQVHGSQTSSPHLRNFMGYSVFWLRLFTICGNIFCMNRCHLTDNTFENLTFFWCNESDVWWYI